MKRNYFTFAAIAIASSAIASSMLLIPNIPHLTEDVTGQDLTFDEEENNKNEIIDITSGYIKNSSFENDDIKSLTTDSRGGYVISSIDGWTLSGNYGVSDIMTSSATATDNNFGAPGTPSDGNQMYYIRNAWAQTTASLTQNITLPAGKYKFTADNKCITTGSSTASLIAGNESTSFTYESTMIDSWNTTSVTFEISEETTVKVGVQINFQRITNHIVITCYLLLIIRVLRISRKYRRPLFLF